MPFLLPLTNSLNKTLKRYYKLISIIIHKFSTMMVRLVLLLVAILQISPMMGCPANCDCPSNIKRVDCSGKSKMKIPQDIPLDTEILLLNNNFIQTIEKQDLAGLTHLKVLQLQENSITYIEDDSFKDLSNLTQLSISENQLHRITGRTFSGLTKLETLWMSNFHPKSLPPCVHDRAFARMANLISLVLIENEFLYLSDQIFYGLQKLKTLELTLSKIQSVSVRAFQYFTSQETTINLGSLDFSSGLCCCGTATAIQPFLNGRESKCTLLNCKHENTFCTIRYNGTCAIDLTGTTTTTTTTTQKPTTTTTTTTTTTVKQPSTTEKATGSTTTTTTQSTTEEPQTEPLTLPPATGTCPDQCTCRDKTISCINLPFLRTIPRNIPADTERLILTQTGIERVRRYDLYKLTNLKDLQLHRNRIHTIEDGSFEDLVNLTNLYLNDNKLERITMHTFTGLKKLKTLWMAKCSGDTMLRMDDETFLGMNLLDSLNLKSIPFVYFSRGLFVGLNNLKELEFSPDLVSVVHENVFSNFPETVSYRVIKDFEMCCCSTAKAIKSAPTFPIKSSCTIETCNSTKAVCSRDYYNTVDWMPVTTTTTTTTTTTKTTTTPTTTTTTTPTTTPATTTKTTPTTKATTTTKKPTTTTTTTLMTTPTTTTLSVNQALNQSNRATKIFNANTSLTLLLAMLVCLSYQLWKHNNNCIWKRNDFRRKIKSF